MRFLYFLPLLLLAACSNMPKMPDVTGAITPYRIDVRQGNFVTQEMAARLRPGMTKDQVKFVLGTPLVADIFHADRWDYVYSFKPGHGERQQRRLTVFFKEGKLARVDGDVVSQGAGDSGTEAGDTSRGRIIDIAGEKKENAVAEPTK